MLSHIITVICRLVADILNDIALCLDLLAPIFPVLFMTIICASSVTKVSIMISIFGYKAVECSVHSGCSWWSYSCCYCTAPSP